MKLLILALTGACALPTTSLTDTTSTTTYVVYDSACNIAVSTFWSQGCLGATLQNWGWGSFSLNATAPAGLPSGGAVALSIQPGWSSSFWLHGSFVFLLGDLLTIEFYAYNAGAAGAQLRFSLCGGNASSTLGKDVLSPALASKAWTKVTLPFASFFEGMARPPDSQQVNGMKILVPPRSTLATAAHTPVPTMPLKAPTHHLDNGLTPLRPLSAAETATPLAQHGQAHGYTVDDSTVYFTDVIVTGTVRSVKTASARAGTVRGRTVSPRLFGTNFADYQSGIVAPGFTAHRWGGNAVTRYAWDLDVQNRAQDWYFENIANPVADVSALPDGTSSDQFVSDTLKAKAMPVITIPTLGLMPFDRTKRCAFSVAKYGAQNRTDGDCGNGKYLNGSTVVGNDVSDTTRAVNASYALGWLDHLASTFGQSMVDSSLFILDNEPNFWSGTHRDVHPKALTYDELWSYTRTYGSAVRAAHPATQIAGPDTSSFQALWEEVTSSAGHKLPLIEAFIRDVASYHATHGVKLLDYLDIHCYPEASYNASRLTYAAEVTMRMRLTRELWDASFFAESWQLTPTYYLRRVREAIDTYAPWLKMSCTEWNYNKGFSDTDVLGAVQSVDALAVYAREGVDLATKWTGPKAGTVTEYGLLQFLHDYDGHGATIAGASYVNVTTDSDMLGAHGFLAADGHTFYTVLVCKQYAGSMVTTVELPAAFAQAAVHTYRLDAQHTARGSPEALTLAGGSAHVTVAPMSATMLVATLN